ncbi:hypothetical protein DRN84_02615 [Candidatus Geothermarchaeota archaeon]|nr:MAG: hypothetical protein DRN84_02615 [Candidatus Geothermarchaeota archaeon]
MTGLEDIKPLYKYALLYLYRGGDPLKLSARYGVNQYILYSYYNKFRRELDNIDTRIKLIYSILSEGFSLEDVAEILDWRDFEELVSLVFREYGYEVIRSFRIRRPPREIDIIAYSRDTLFCLECKHWDKLLSPSILREVVKSHIDRCRLLGNISRYIGMKIYPVVITLRHHKTFFEGGVAIIPINGLANFIENYLSLVIDGLLRDVTSL